VVKHADGSLHFLNTTNGADERSLPGPTNSSGDKFLTITEGQVVIRRAMDADT
jgi:hypothetical protein